MAYDEALADRVRAALADHPEIDEKRMFGGLAFLLRGNMAVAVRADALLVRADPDATDALLAARPGAHLALMGGRTMKGWLEVPAEALTEDAALTDWITTGTAYAATLPPK
ncbi:TfoX/Sxy family protein [Streptacidiphilus monticola]|jgi:TfoX/Sxy family transcriptional regulator of competence genes|uniref:TfoX/Sxy family protein n=1 Tax=Streptacidiphilus monticola TaxID=2161674 RepID=A0ABW1FZ17_9ACTN